MLEEEWKLTRKYALLSKALTFRTKLASGSPFPKAELYTPDST